ncbi:hypothetical protein HDU92_009145 [Lobulomyces angularis]|nr:hypothetical protein HDU92_009145 [Lobulomyces angularis]
MASIKDIETLLDKLLDKKLNHFFDENFKPIQEKLDNLSEKVDEKFKTVQVQLDNLNEKVDEKFKTVQVQLDNLNEKVGHTFELAAKQHICKVYGETYARSYVICDIHGLARLTLPKCNQEGEVKFLHNSSLLQNERVKVLAQVIFEDKQLIPCLKKRLRTLDEPRFASIVDRHNKWLDTLKNQMKEFETLKISDQIDFLINEKGFAVALLCSFVVRDNDFNSWISDNDVPIRSLLELDCRGIMLPQQNSYYVEIGEIKSSCNDRSFNTGCRQLSMVLSTLAYCFQGFCKHNNNLPKNVVLQGYVFSPSKGIDEKVRAIYFGNEMAVKSNWSPSIKYPNQLGKKGGVNFSFNIEKRSL